MSKFLWAPFWGALLLFSSCAKGPVQDPDKHEDGTYKTSVITGRFEGFSDYKDWVVYITGFNYKSVVSQVDQSGSFYIKAVNIPIGYYRLVFGKMKTKNLGSTRIRIESLRTHLGIIQAGN
jgi:hypothetical protein